MNIWKVGPVLLAASALSACAHPAAPRDAGSSLVYPSIDPAKRGHRWRLPSAPAVSLDKPEERIVEAILSQYPTGLDAENVRWTAKVIVAESRRNKLDPFLVLALIRIESSGWNWARSDMEARGLMQILPFVGKGLAGEMELPWGGADSLHDPALNVRMGTRLLAEYRDQFDGDLPRALTAYNVGPTRLVQLLEQGRQPADYSTKILWFAARYREIAAADGDVMPGLAHVAVDVATLEKSIHWRPRIALALARAAKPSAEPPARRLLELNGASVADLVTIVPGMTSAQASMLVGWREQHGGRFVSIDDLDRVRGLDREIIARLRDMAWVSRQTEAEG